MKLLVVAILVIGLFMLYQVVVSTPLSSYQFCIDQAQTLKAELYQTSCGARQKVYDDLTSCVASVQKRGAIAAILYAPFGAKSKVDILFSEFTQECPNTPVSVPGESLYL